MDSRRVKRAALAAGLLLAGGGAAALAGRAWLGAEAAPTAAPRIPAPAPTLAAADDGGSDTVEVADGGRGPVDAGLTPMAKRVAVIGILNKRNGVSRDVTLRPGQALRVGDAVVRLRACEHTAPWEPETLTGAFVQVDVQDSVDRKWKRVFSGWLYKEQPQLNVMLHPIYDVWTKSCAMAFPGGTPAAAATPRTASSAPKSAPASPAPADNIEADEAVVPSASDSNAI